MTSTVHQERLTTILRVARRALEEHDYERIQMRDIARDAGMALGTLYRHFTSKEHLYATVLCEWARAAAATTYDDLGSPEQRLRARMHDLITACARRPAFFRAHAALQSSTDPYARALLTELGAVMRAALAAELPALGTARATDTATMLWALVASRLTGTISQDTELSEVHRLTDGFIDLLAPTLRPLPA